MNNDPLLFIDSVFEKKEGKENQEVYDSRQIINKKKKLITYRIEDIRAMMFFKINIYLFIQTKEGLFEGYIENINDEEIYLKDKDTIKRIEINTIEDIIVKKM